MNDHGMQTAHDLRHVPIWREHELGTPVPDSPDPETHNIHDLARGMQGDHIALFVWGEITFRDSFDRRRKLSFRYMSGVRRSDGSFHLAACEDGNEETEITE